MHHLRSYWLAALLGLSAVALGCGGPEEQVGCASEDEIHGVCAGVPMTRVCDSDSCTEGVNCSQVLEASDDSSLASAIQGAQSGACISLSSGTYKAADLPGGVSLLGPSASDVTV